MLQRGWCQQIRTGAFLSLLVLFVACAPAKPATLHLFIGGDAAAADTAALLSADLKRLDPHKRISFNADAADLTLRLQNGTPSVPGSFALSGAGGEYVVAATGPLGWQYGVWELLERAGMLYAHPEQLVLPDALCIRCIGEISEVTAPVFSMRGTHMHTMHPIEYESTLLGSDAATEVRFDKLLAWLAARRQNYVEWNLLRTVDFGTWFGHARNLAASAHRRGFRIGIVVPFAFKQQNSYMLLDPKSPLPVTTQIGLEVDKLMQVPWDMLNVEMGASEFFAVSDVDQLAWLDYLTDYTHRTYPGTGNATKVHISSDQYAPNFGNINFNFLPQFADRRMGVMPHTVQFYDLYRPAPTYGQTDFSEMRQFLLSQIGQRPVYYYPETAYFVSFDVDVPIALPQYIYSRWNDLHRLRNSGMDGQINFSSGFEWGYWLHDFATSWYAYSPEVTWTVPLQRAFQVFGSAAAKAVDVYKSYIEWQGDELLQKNGVRWLIAWEPADDLGELVGIFAQPKRVRIHHIQKMDADTLRAFRTGEFGQVQLLVTQTANYAKQWRALATHVAEAGRTIYEELALALDITAVRAAFIQKVYEATLVTREGELGLDPDGQQTGLKLFGEAKKLIEKGLAIVRKQEKNYRFPQAEIAEDRESFTSYPFGYLRTVTDLWYWRREFDEASDPESFNMMESLYDLIKTGGF